MGREAAASQPPPQAPCTSTARSRAPGGTWYRCSAPVDLNVAAGATANATAGTSTASTAATMNTNETDRRKTNDVNRGVYPDLTSRVHALGVAHTGSSRSSAALASLSALAGCALALWVGLSGGTVARAATSLRACSAGELAPVYVDSTAAAGSRDAEYAFKSIGGRRCELTGFPKVQMLAASGAALSTTELHASGAFGITVGPVILADGSPAYFDIHYAAATGYGNLRCPMSAALSLVAPGDRRGGVVHGVGGRIEPFGGTTVHLHCGIVRVSAVTAKRFQ